MESLVCICMYVCMYVYSLYQTCRVSGTSIVGGGLLILLLPALNLALYVCFLLFSDIDSDVNLLFGLIY